jgi:hypothetical protein
MCAFWHKADVERIFQTFEFLELPRPSFGLGTLLPEKALPSSGPRTGINVTIMEKDS